MKKYIRLGNITFSKEFIERMKEFDLLVTRRDKFVKPNVIMLNHGNSNNIAFGSKVNNFVLLNHPRSIRFCANKLDTYNALTEYSPQTYLSKEDVDTFPIIAKRITGYHGYGATVINTPEELQEFNGRGYLYQKLLNIKYEYRFNVLDGEVYQVSRRAKRNGEMTDKGGYSFSYKSLGKEAKISDKFWIWVCDVIGKIESEIGNDLAHYALDVIKTEDGKYYVCELNSACGLGDYTLTKLLKAIDKKYNNGDLEKYRVR